MISKKRFLQKINYIPMLGFVTIMISFSACERTIDIHLEEDPVRIVLNSIINPDSTIVVQLSNSISSLSGNYFIQPLTEATVELFEDGNIAVTLNEMSEGQYTSAGFYPSTGKTYTIKASHQNYNSVQATAAIPENVIVASAVYTESGFVNPDNGSVQDEIKVSFKDPGGLKNYYSLLVFSSDTLGYNNVISCFTNDPNLDQDVQQVLSEFLLSDETFDGKQYSTSLGINTSGFSNSGSHIFFVLKTVDENYYQYFKTLPQAFNSQNNPFAEPVQVFNNIENGLGILGSYNSSTVKVK